MTVEQRIIPKSLNKEGNMSIYPGQEVNTLLVALESKHPHDSFSAVFKVYCAEDDSCGVVEFNHPEAGPITKVFSKDNKPFYLIETPDGIGLVEWEHKKD